MQFPCKELKWVQILLPAHLFINNGGYMKKTGREYLYDIETDKMNEKHKKEIAVSESIKKQIRYMQNTIKTTENNLEQHKETLEILLNQTFEKFEKEYDSLRGYAGAVNS